MFPDELSYLRQSADQHAEVLVIGDQLVSFAVEIILERAVHKPQPVPPIASRITHGLCARAIKSFRSSLLLGRLGSVHDMTAISRSMFETLIAIAFVASDQVKLGLKDVDDLQLTQDFRAKLYWAFLAVDKLSGFKKLRSNEHTKAVASQIDGTHLETNAALAEQHVGPQWTARFAKPPYTYSGLNLGQLTEQLGPDYSRLYRGLYGSQSKAVHAVDYTDHVTHSESDGQILVRWFAPPRECVRVVAYNGILLCQCLSLLNGLAGFGPDVEPKIQRLMQTFGKIHENT